MDGNISAETKNAEVPCQGLGAMSDSGKSDDERSVPQIMRSSNRNQEREKARRLRQAEYHSAAKREERRRMADERRRRTLGPMWSGQADMLLTADDLAEIEVAAEQTLLACEDGRYAMERRVPPMIERVVHQLTGNWIGLSAPHCSPGRFSWQEPEPFLTEEEKSMSRDERLRSHDARGSWRVLINQRLWNTMPRYGRYVAACLLGYAWARTIAQPHREVAHWWCDPFALALLMPRCAWDRATAVAPHDNAWLADLLQVPRIMVSKRRQMLKTLDAGHTTEEQYQAAHLLALRREAQRRERDELPLVDDVIADHIEEIADHFYNVVDFNSSNHILVIDADGAISWCLRSVAAVVFGPGWPSHKEIVAPIDVSSVRVLALECSAGRRVRDVDVSEIGLDLLEKVAGVAA